MNNMPYPYMPPFLQDPKLIELEKKINDLELEIKKINKALNSLDINLYKNEKQNDDKGIYMM